MCGIWLVLNYKFCTINLIKHFEKIKHRGPDSYRIERIPSMSGTCIGFHRLAIIGDNRSMQPLSHKEFPNLHIACNGEIYNFKNLGKCLQLPFSFHSDIECIFHLYNKFGVDKMASYLDGMFGIALVDDKAKKAFLIRDPIGIRPLYFLQYTDNCIIAASEAKGLQDLAAECNGNIVVVNPGTIVEISILNNIATVTNIRQYYRLGQVPIYSTLLPNSLTYDIYGNIRSLLKNAVRKRLLSERKICCFLSGGLDSSIIAGLICEIFKEAPGKENLQQLETFSVGMSKNGIDQICARQVARHLNTLHQEVVFSFEDIIKELPNIVYCLESFDSCSIRATVGLYFLCKFVNENSDCVVILTGDGSDELACGYEHFKEIKDPSKSQKESDRLLLNLHYFDIRRCDSCLSGFGLEGRVPFLDHMFLAYYRSLDPTLKQSHDKIEKWLLRKSFDSDNFLPKNIIWRQKFPFGMGLEASDKDMLKEQLDTYFDSVISDEEFQTTKDQYEFLPPKTKQDLQYRKYFEQFFPKQYSICPISWQ